MLMQNANRLSARPSCATAFISVIIPTYNRKESLLRALHSLSDQSITTDCFEVIVVDDGSTDDSCSVAQMAFPFVFKYLRRENQGATQARNYGAISSEGVLLVFMDDDVTVSRETLGALLSEYVQNDNAIILGALTSRSEATNSVFARIMSVPAVLPTQHEPLRRVHYCECNTQLLAITRGDFFALGMFEDPTGGWPNWDDVDFGYRAYSSGFSILRTSAAAGIHWDYSLSNLTVCCQRWYRACKAAPKLFQKYPALRPEISMLRDKETISWQRDAPNLIAHKLARRIISGSVALPVMELGTRIAENFFPSPSILHHLYNWIIGSYMLRGYQEGLQGIVD